MQRKKTELARITWEIAKQYVKFDATNKHNEHNILSYKTYNTTQHNINLTTLKENIYIYKFSKSDFTRSSSLHIPLSQYYYKGRI